MLADNTIDLNEPFKFLRSFKDKTNKINLVIEVSPVIFREIMKTKVLYYNWQKYFCDETFNVIQCFSCNGFGHFANKCPGKDKPICYKCAGEHNYTNCDNKNTACINCVKNNDRFKTNVDINHSAKDRRNCQSYIKTVELIRNQINYDI